MLHAEARFRRCDYFTCNGICKQVTLESCLPEKIRKKKANQIYFCFLLRLTSPSICPGLPCTRLLWQWSSSYWKRNHWFELIRIWSHPTVKLGAPWWPSFPDSSRADRRIRSRTHRGDLGNQPRELHTLFALTGLKSNWLASDLWMAGFSLNK